MKSKFVPRLAAALTLAVAITGLAPVTVPNFAPKAEAIIGMPATPMSYAGVARRTTYRAVTAPVYVAPAPVVVVAPRPGCYQVASPYGGVTWHCP